MSYSQSKNKDRVLEIRYIEIAVLFVIEISMNDPSDQFVKNLLKEE